MIKLTESLNDWGNKSFSKTLELELVKLGSSNLPLQQAASPGTLVSNADIGVTVLTVRDCGIEIQAKVGIMFSEILWGYCCGEEEPMINNAYCELSVCIHKVTADTKFIM